MPLHDFRVGDVVLWSTTSEEYVVVVECQHGVLATQVHGGHPGRVIPVVFLWSSDIEFERGGRDENV